MDRHLGLYAVNGCRLSGDVMDLEKFTERSRGFIQAAQGLALRSGHQQLTNEHLLKVLLDDKEGLAAASSRRLAAMPREPSRQ